MKKALSILAALAFAGSAFAQGTIQLSNTDLPNPSGPGTYNAPVFRPGGTVGAGPGFTAGLFLEGSIAPLATTPFFSDAAFPDFHWVFQNNPQATVPGQVPGSTPRFVVRAWETSAGSYELSTIRGESAGFTSRPLGGPNPTPGELPFTTPVTTFTGFTMVPEPTSLALGAIGLGALLLRRRK